MEKRRDRHEIVAEILNIAVDGKIKTHIMYKAKLSYSQVNEYLPLLVAKGFLENSETAKIGQRTTIYKTTPKGLEFMESLKYIDKLWAKGKKTPNEPPKISET
jgi:predicted transcriptional regulator